MATIYIRDDSGQEQLIKDLKIRSGRIITPDMQKGIPDDGEFKYVKKVEELNFDDINLDEINLDEINVNSAPGMMLSSTVINAISQYIEATIQSMIAGKSTELLQQLGINEENLEFTNQILDIIDTTTFKINSIIKMVPKNIKMIPSGNSFMSSLTTSLKDMYEAIWLDIQNKYYMTINDAITNLPSSIEALHDAQEALLKLAEGMISDLTYQYTGKTLPELLYICRGLIAKYKEYREKIKLARQGIDIKNISHIEINPDAVKKELLLQLATCSDMVYNAFMILQIKQSINDIRILIQQFQHINLEVLADGIQNFEDFMNLMIELGVDQESSVITLKDAIKSGINTIQNSFNSLSAQLTAQAMVSGAQVLATTIKNTSVYSEQVVIQNYSFDFDLNTRTITIIFEREPTTKHIRKNLNSALSKAKDDDGKFIFSQAEVKQIFEVIDKGLFEYKDQELTTTNFNIKIKFNIDGYNIEEQKNENSSGNKLIDIVNESGVLTQYYDRLEQIEQERIKAENDVTEQFELGIVTEEYSKDPVAMVRRPTIQLVHELFGILQEIFPLLKLLATLVSNYKINKAKVENNAQGNLFGMIRFLSKVNKLLNQINTDNKNFYTVRTLKLYDYIIENIKKQETDKPEIELNNDETKTLYNYLIENNLTANEINTELDTLLYIDIESIQEQQEELKNEYETASQYFKEDTSLFIDYPDTKYKDGTIIGLDKIQKAGNEIYYSDSSLPIINSQIMRCYKKDLDVSL